MRSVRHMTRYSEHQATVSSDLPKLLRWLPIGCSRAPIRPYVKVHATGAGGPEANQDSSCSGNRRCWKIARYCFSTPTRRTHKELRERMMTTMKAAVIHEPGPEFSNWSLPIPTPKAPSLIPSRRSGSTVRTVYPQAIRPPSSFARLGIEAVGVVEQRQR